MTYSNSLRWIVGFWFLLDLYGAMYIESNIAYAAHVGGFITGAFLAWYGMGMNWFDQDGDYQYLRF